MRAELLFPCAYARTYARFFSPFVLGICSFSSVMIDVCLVSYNVLQVCDCFSVTLNKKDMSVLPGCNNMLARIVGGEV